MPSVQQAYQPQQPHRNADPAYFARPEAAPYKAFLLDEFQKIFDQCRQTDEIHRKIDKGIKDLNAQMDALNFRPMLDERNDQHKQLDKIAFDIKDLNVQLDRLVKYPPIA